jgi:lantibiotic modifying enzyme
MTLARFGAMRYLRDEGLSRDIDAGLSATLLHGFGRNHSLCHGDLGNLEVLLQATRSLEAVSWKGHFERQASRILAAGSTVGWRSGIPLDVESPGLMTGLAGIGFGLLRAAHPEEVPSVLMLEPPC